MRITNKEIVITKDSDGKLSVRETVNIACDDQDEALRVERTLRVRLEETIRVIEKAAKLGRLPPTEAA